MTDNKTEQNVQDLEEHIQLSVELELPLNNIGDTLIIDHISFIDNDGKDNYYDNLIVSKDFLGTVTTIKREDNIEMVIHHEYYISVSVNKEDEVIEFGLDNFILSILLLSIITPVIFLRKKIFKKKK